MAVLTKEYQLLGQSYLGSSGGDLYIRIYAKYSEQSIDNNRSKVQYQARANFTGSYIYDQQSSGSVIGTGASQVNYSKSSNYGNGETVLGTTEGWVNHDNDGKATISGSAHLSFPNWGWSTTANGSADLPTIPRNSTITGTSAYVEETSQLTITRYKEQYTHSIHYTFGSLSGYILANGTTTSTETKLTALSIGFPIPSSWYNQMTNVNEKICTLAIKTYNGNTQVGNTYEATFYVRVNPSTNKPTVSSSVSDTNNTTYALTGNRNILIKGNSTASVTWSATAKNGASISNVKINGNTASTSPYAFTLNSNTISVVATDSRGLSTTSNPSFTLKNYFNPTLTMPTIYRANPTDNFATLKFNGTWFNSSFGSQNNTLTITWKYRETGTSSWTSGGTLTNNTHYKISGNNFWSGTGSSASEIHTPGSALVYEKNWDVAITITDKLKSVTVVGQITKGIPVINWGEDFLNVNGDIKQNNVNIFESGTGYIKYCDGTMICYGSSGTGVISWSQDSTIWYKRALTLPNFAQTFISAPIVSKTIQSMAPVDRHVWISGTTAPSTTNPGNYNLATYWNASNTSVTVSYIAIGKWR